MVKIGDFNVSRTLKSGLARTQIGTPYYMRCRACAPVRWPGTLTSPPAFARRRVVARIQPRDLAEPPL